MNPRWDQQIKVNRVEYDSMMQALCNPISKDLCPIILRLEHTVTELSKLSDQNQGEGGRRGEERFCYQMLYIIYVCDCLCVCVTVCGVCVWCVCERLCVCDCVCVCVCMYVCGCAARVPVQVCLC